MTQRSGEKRDEANGRLTVAAMLDNIEVGDYILYTDHDATLFDEEKERTQFIAINAVTERHENKKVACDIRPPVGWVAEHVELDAPNLNIMTCGDHFSAQRGGAWT
jgi:hypothetical protein